MKKYIKLIRPHHYIKNALLFFPLIFSGHLFDIPQLCSLIYGFFSFSLISSVVYIINDINDADNDAKHPTKCKRPIAAGLISKKAAALTAVLLFILAVGLNWLADGFGVYSYIMLLTYMLLNILYSFGLKNVPIVDIVILVSGFVLRVVYGAQITDTAVSGWLYLTVMSLSFYMGLGKRRGELINTAAPNNTRKVLKYYTKDFLSKNMYMFLTLTIAFYSLWCMDSLTAERHTNGNFIITVPLVILICMKYSMNIEGNSDGDPVEVIRRDKWLIALVALYALAVLCILYI